MTDADLRKILALIAHWEGRVPWPYLDNAESPNVTIGVGCLVATVDDLRALPLRRYADDQVATPSEIGAEFCRLRSILGGQRAAAYRGGYYLAEPDIDELAREFLRGIVAALPAVFPAFERLPNPAQACVCDLAWNVGVPGLRSWHRLREALAASPPDWIAAADNCSTANPQHLAGRASRNAWRVSCMNAAAEGRPTPGVL